jgi:CubicO group peptidase (beta-lactamase class C family)
LFAGFDVGAQPGAAVGISIGGAPAYARGFGRAHLELPVPLAPDMRMRLGSISKHFTALLLLLLCEEGKAALDDPLGRWLPNLPSAVGAVSLEMLAQHLSGLRDVMDIVWHVGGTGPHLETFDFLDLYRRIDAVQAPAGFRFTYNNGGYLLLSVALEAIGGASLAELLERYIFAPAGMRATLLRASDADFVDNSASLHMIGADGVFRKEYLGTVGGGAGGVVSTIDDMLLWLAQFFEPTIGTPGNWARVATSGQLPNGIATHYGLGLIASEYRGARVLWHSGGVMGGHAQMLVMPSAGLGIITIVNRHDASAVRLTEQIIDAIVPDLDHCENEASPEALGEGIYRSPTSGRVISLARRGAATIATVDGSDETLASDGAGRWGPAGARSYVARRLSVANEALLFDDYGASEWLETLPPPSDAAPLPEPEELFVSADAGLAATARFGKDLLQMTGLGGQQSYALTPLGLGVWQARATSIMGWTGIVAVDADARGFAFSNARTRALRFVPAGHGQSVPS